MSEAITLEQVISSEKGSCALFQEIRTEERKALECGDDLITDFTGESDMMSSRMAGLIQQLERGTVPDSTWYTSMTKSYVLTDDPNFDKFYSRIKEDYPAIRAYIDHLLAQYELLTKYIEQQL